ncbi:TPA: DegV family protein, partial [Streptococcus pyogenes]|nr:DegV family protein [Streptococcus pyogenes]
MEKYMGTIKIVTDSSITIEPELIKALDITVVPLSVMIDSKLYSDNDLKEEGHFLSLMKASKSLPKTSQPPVGLFAETYENLVKKGVTDIVAIHLSPALSGTIEASRQGAEIAEAPVTVLDSGFTDQAMKFQVVEAAKMAKAGASLNEILAAVQAIKSKTELYIGVSTLE